MRDVMNFSVFISTETSGSPGHVFFILLHWDKKGRVKTKVPARHA